MAGFPKKTVLISPLDWGLGHATRCVPVIQELINQQVEVILGVSGLSGEWLKPQFPTLETVDVPFRKIEYHLWQPMVVTAILKYPVFLKMIEEENQWLKSFCKLRKINGIISDNRYGFYHRNIPSVCITHQLYIQTGNIPFVKPLLNKLTRAYLRPFQQIWVPDFPGHFNLSGTLSHPPFESYPIKYVGLLSRFNGISTSRQEDLAYSVAFVLSGPEPLRTVFENRCIEIAAKLNAPTIIIRGTNKPLKSTIPKGCHVIDMADTKQLYQIIQQSACVVSRAGYSSIMDWYALKKKAVLVPTPGQTEQEYLSKHLSRLGLFEFVKESELSVQAIQRASFTSHQVNQQSTLSNVVYEWLQQL